MSKKAKYNYYVVWNGIKPGVYSNWPECQKNVNGFTDAKFKGFTTQLAANKAYLEGPDGYWGLDKSKRAVTSPDNRKIGYPIMKSISVDAAWNSSTLDMEYQGVYTDTKEVIFRMGPFKHGTNNVGEFLAIVHGLAWLKERKSDIPVYSDSRNAIGWVKSKQHRSKLIKDSYNSKIFELLERAEKWLKKNHYQNKILKWETKAWGENPADFGRK